MTRAYDAIAEGYAALNATSLLNEYYNRPAIAELAGEVAGRRILDAGCGSGPISADLRDRGAVVTGIDASAGMLDQARLRLGPDADLLVADLAEPLPFADDSFDDVIASQALHYLEEWGPTLAEFRRVLRPGGRLIVSEEHPAAIFLADRLGGGSAEYFGVRARTEEWSLGGQTAQLVFWDRPLHAMTDAFAAAGFRITAISEPAPSPAAYERFPEAFVDRPSGRFLAFLLFVLEAPGA
ncbi:class I SAM-dependent methyltransferase [Leifsonia sp. F6_8S_P_1B]|uniref:Class I SAM-dependent methyltransferase n=1 Tax=Leifsonia williamsii TaxID=3035919 RepID=A0ABT8KD00_9MICO|nr:class I SAM-dependent methyltransferase [Leifsonia williamsii]MDN4615326.1 class I SAM-dependent methyltransferase [Leifsonia williamsii]